MSPVFPRSASQSDHDEVTAFIADQRDRDLVVAELRHDVASLKTENAKHEAATWRRIGILQWLIGLMVVIVLAVGGGLLRTAYGAFEMFGNRLIVVDKQGQERTEASSKEMTAAVNDLKIQVVKLEAEMKVRLQELGARLDSSDGARRAGIRPERGERGTW